jgi:hypothetical protein
VRPVLWGMHSSYSSDVQRGCTSNSEERERDIGAADARYAWLQRRARDAKVIELKHH